MPPVDAALITIVEFRSYVRSFVRDHTILWMKFMRLSAIRVLCAHVQVQGTALIRAATQGHADCVRLLLDVGADKDAQDKVRCRSLLPLLSVLKFYRTWR